MIDVVLLFDADGDILKSRIGVFTSAYSFQDDEIAVF